jgi:uroporphyrin-III C-methyltransferase
VVLYDALVDPALQQFAPRARWVAVGKRGYEPSTAQVAINALLMKYAAECDVVVRLKGGDPSVFGRLEEELESMAAAGIDTEVVPGVTAAMAAAAATQRPLTRRVRGRSVSLSTAVTNEHRLQGGCHADTEVFYMAGKRLAALARRLILQGWPADTPAMVVSRAGWPDQLHTAHSLCCLGQAALLHGGRPAVVTIGAGAMPLQGLPSDSSLRAPPVDNHQGPVATPKP